MKTEDFLANETLPSGKILKVIEGNGLHYFKAIMESKGDNILFLKNIIIQLIFIDNKSLTLEDLDWVSLRDISRIMEIVGAMLSENYKITI